MKIPFSYTMMASIISPLLACCVSANAPSTIHVIILPHQNIVGYSPNHNEPVNNQNIESADFRAQAFITSVNIARHMQCSEPEYYTEGHFSSREALYRQCAYSLNVTILGHYQLREGRSNHLVDYVFVKGYAEIAQYFARSEGDSELIPFKKRQLQDQPLPLSEDEAMRSALNDFTHRIEYIIRQKLADHSTVIVVDYL